MLKNNAASNNQKKSWISWVMIGRPTVNSILISVNISIIYFYLCFWYLCTFNIRYLKQNVWSSDSVWLWTNLPALCLLQRLAGLHYCCALKNRKQSCYFRIKQQFTYSVLLIKDYGRQDIKARMRSECASALKFWSTSWGDSERPAGGAAVLYISTLPEQIGAYIISLFLHCSLSSHSSAHLDIHHSWRSLLAEKEHIQMIRRGGKRRSGAVRADETETAAEIEFKDYN